MEPKTKVTAEEGKQEMVITREFELPLELLFKAYVEAEIVERWMGTKVQKLESKKHGSYQFETINEQGKVVFKAHGVIHEFIPNHKITRTFEIENTPFPIQLEFLEFQKITHDISKLDIHIIYKSVADRDHILKLPFAHGLNMAHDRLQNLFINLK
jgi:uncharacterized protein YndB with AHSA1/START domain